MSRPPLHPRTLAALAAATALVTPATLVTAPGAAAAGAYVPGAAGAGDPYFPLQGNGGYDVGHYGVRLQFTPATQRLVGDVTITATATQDLSRFDLDLRDLTVGSVSVDGAPAAYAHHGQELVVTPAHGLPAGSAFTVRVRYAGVPQAVTDPDGSIEGWVATPDGAFVVGEPQGTPAWLPCNDTPTDKATYDFRATVPKGVTAIANGDLVGRSSAAGRTTWHWREAQPMSTYLATVTSGVFDVRTGRTRSGIPYFLASDPKLTSPAKHALSKTPAIVDFFSSVYGPYPYGSTGGVVDDAPDVGYSLENQTKPQYAYAPDELTVAHELAHQWFGDDVTLNRWRNIWLNEGFAEFSMWLWSEHTGQTSAQQFFQRWYAKPAKSWVWTPPPGNPGDAADIFAGSVYERGAMTLQALRRKIGDPTFFRLMRHWLAAHRYGNGSVRQFIAMAERESGRDLGHFFDVWLFRDAKPTSW
ncbi:MAG: M1 family metallopeptidase [Frankiaceae bacterium]